MKVLIGGALVRGSHEDFPRPSSCYSYQCPCTVYIAIHKDGDLEGQVQGQTFLCHSQLVVIRRCCLKDIILMLEAVPRHVLWVQLRLRCGQQRSHVPETVGAHGLAGCCALHKVCSQETLLVLTTFLRTSWSSATLPIPWLGPVMGPAGCPAASEHSPQPGT